MIVTQKGFYLKGKSFQIIGQLKKLSKQYRTVEQVVLADKWKRANI